MGSRRVLSEVLMLALAIWSMVFFQASAIFAANGSDPGIDGMEVLTRGPIHEAFADVSVDEAAPVMVTSIRVPDPIQETPPDYRPEGENVQWIPGYWSWDDDRNDFIWVSGIWRDVPPGQQWNPGYWISADGRNQFVSGYWTDSRPAETVYLPAPPEPPQAVPGSPALSSDDVWVDGHWLWSNNRYVWQGGYWLRQRPDMVWVPAHYVWTPRGYIFVRGYWDYQLVRRGVMFAPRYYSRPIYRTPHYHYTPSIVLDLDSILLSLFIRRDHRHYYFGDYYDIRYERRGFIPWYSKHATRHGYDPCYRSYRWYRLREDKHWERDYQRHFQYRRDHREARPPVVYRPHDENGYDWSRGKHNHLIGRPLAEVIEKRGHRAGFIRPEPDHEMGFKEYGRKVSTSRGEGRAAQMAPEQRERSWEAGYVSRAEKKRVFTSSLGEEAGRDSLHQSQEGKKRDKQRVRPDQQKTDKSRDHTMKYRTRETETEEIGQLRNHEQTRKIMAVDDQSDIRSRKVQPGRTYRQKEDRMHGRSYENGQRPRQSSRQDEHKRGQDQAKQRKRPPVEEGSDGNGQLQPQADRQGNRSERVQDQNTDQPRGKRKT